MAESSRPPAALRSGELGWRVLPARGASVKVLRHDKETGGSTALVRFEAGTRFPAHNHPAGEEIWARNINSVPKPAVGQPPDPMADTKGGLLDFDSTAACVSDDRW